MSKKFLSRQGLMNQKIIAPQPCDLPSGEAVLMRVPGAKDWRAYQASLRDKDGKYIDKRLERGDELLIATVLIDPDTLQPMFSVDDVLAGAFDDPHITAADINAMSNRAYELYGRTDSPKFVTDEDREKNLSETAPSE